MQGDIPLERVAAVAVLYLVRELTGIRVPVPQLRRQVPDWWRTYFGRPLAAFLYGAGLGVGFFTFDFPSAAYAAPSMRS